jgi:hypothetical protein
MAASFAGRIPALQEGLHLTAGELGLALLMVSLGCVSTMQYGAVVAARGGQRTVLLAGFACWAVLLPLVAVAPSVLVLCLLLFLVGVGSGNADVAMNALGVHVERRVGRSIMSGLHGLWSVGGVGGAAIAALCAHQGISPMRQFAGVGVVVAIVVALCWRRWEDPAAGRSTDHTPGFAWPTRRVLVIGLIAFSAVFVEFSGTDWSAVFLRDVTSASPGTAALGVVAVASAMALGRLTGDFVVRRVGAVATVRTGGLVVIVGVAVLLTTSASWSGIVAFGLLGLGVSTAVPLTFAAAGRIGGDHPGQQIAAVATLGYGAGMASPFLIGLVTQLSSIQVAFGIVGLLALGIVALAPRLRT